MGLGIFLLILGAILLFAVRGDTSVVDLQTVGIILMVAGAVIVYLTRNGTIKVRKVRTVDDTSDPDRPVHTVYETVTEKDPNSEH
ncbi:MAG TPA: DUF6458 family protein [Marmoricola sp.]|nr:DUF6458 family protein [Marmoricola sp.]